MRRARGMTILEVVLALALLLGSVMALSRVAFLARRHSVSGEDQTRAQLLCYSIMQELMAGIQPLQPVSEQAVQEDPQWIYSVEVQELGDAPLLAVAVTVARLPDEEPDVLALEEEELSGYRLVRWIRAHDRLQEEEPAAEDTTTAAPSISAPRPWTWRPQRPAGPTEFEGDAYTAPDDQ